MYLRFGKRVCDIVVGLIALPFVLIIVAICAPLIYFEDKGPIFYNAPRVGKDGRDFTMYKLRSMKVNAPDLVMEDGSTYNGADDPRMTRIGAFMRKASIDEMPQFINVLPWRDRMKLDVYYVRHVSFALDVKVFFRTFYVIFKQDGVYVEPEDGGVKEASN